MEANQLKTQENQPEDSKALAELLNQQKVRNPSWCPSQMSPSQEMLSFFSIRKSPNTCYSSSQVVIFM